MPVYSAREPRKHVRYFVRYVLFGRRGHDTFATAEALCAFLNGGIAEVEVRTYVYWL